MRWRYFQAQFYPGFDPGGFVTVGGDQGPDSEGVRTILLNYQQQAARKFIQVAIDPDGQVGDLWVLTNGDGVGNLEMRIAADPADLTGWVTVTDDPDTTFTIPGHDGTIINVDLRVTIPTLDPPDPVEMPLTLYWDIPAHAVTIDDLAGY